MTEEFTFLFILSPSIMNVINNIALLCCIEIKSYHSNSLLVNNFPSLYEKKDKMFQDNKKKLIINVV